MTCFDLRKGLVTQVGGRDLVAHSILDERTPLAATRLSEYLNKTISFLREIGLADSCIERLFQRDLNSLNQLILSGESRYVYDDNLLECFYEVLTVKELLNILFPENFMSWLSQPHAAFSFATPKEMLPSAGLSGMALIRMLLEKELNAIQH